MSEPAPVTLRWSGQTDRGRVRKNNEDAFLALRFDAREAQLLGKTGEASTAEADFAFAVSDGMGGAAAGEYASRVAVEKIQQLLPRAFKQTALGFNAGIEDVLGTLFDEVHRALSYLGASYEECAGMGATLTLAWFTPGWLHFGHIGDSRLYFLPAAAPGEPGETPALRQVTEDDTHVGWLRRRGKLNEREARTHPGRHSLQKALGAGHQFTEPQVGSIGYGPGDRFLLCTDGLTDGLYDDHLRDLLRAPAEPAAPPLAQRLVTASVAASGRDNTTALVVEAGAIWG